MKVDSSKLKEYMVLLQEQMQTAVRTETGVISYHVYADKTNPTKLTIVEVYELSEVKDIFQVQKENNNN